ncbi:cyclic peptide export ABC transporter [Caenispirillum salinarum]|uniref:cyclic peptide export ABC transporter n=1 Tax=Caenispirillum salinarum TaxID=859058 RepID=UPI0038501D88
MQVLQLFHAELSRQRWKFMMMGALSGSSNAAVLAVINHAAASLDEKGEMMRSLIMFVAAIALYVVSQKWLLTTATRASEVTVHKLRERIVERIRRAELQDMERLSSAEIYATVSREAKALAETVPLLMVSGQALIMTVFVVIYIAWLSMTAFFLLLGTVVAGALIHLARSKEVARQFAETDRLEGELVDGFRDMLDGFKEVKMNSTRSAELGDMLSRLSSRLTDRKVETAGLFAGNLVASQVAFFIMIGVMVFVVPKMADIGIDKVGMITTAALFLMGPISNVVSGVPLLTRANASANAMLKVEAELRELEQPETGSYDPFSDDFDMVRLRDVTFSHASGRGDAPGEHAFHVGPVNLEIRKCEVLFITGGNGSGKSTLLKLMTALYHPDGGAVMLDERRVTPENAQSYRDRFCVIFSDNHLFRELYGVETVDWDEAMELLHLLEMDHKVRLVDRRFSTVSLSGGQRKRLALIAAMLEKRPICVFDEWAADQDPYFRWKFYREILPRLRDQGKTIIAVTHDDKYFDVADHRVHMEEGQLSKVSEGSATGHHEDPA